jgi:hypothetical protein
LYIKPLVAVKPVVDTAPANVPAPVTVTAPLIAVDVAPSVNAPVLGLNVNAVVANTVLVL